MGGARFGGCYGKVLEDKYQAEMQSYSKLFWTWAKPQPSAWEKQRPGLCQSIFLCLGVPRGPRLFWFQFLMCCSGNTNKPWCCQAGTQQEVPLLTAGVGNAFPKPHTSFYREERLARGNVSRNGIWAFSASISHPVPGFSLQHCRWEPGRTLSAWSPSQLSPVPPAPENHSSCLPSLPVRRWLWWGRGSTGFTLATQKRQLRVVQRAVPHVPGREMKELFPSVSSSEFSSLIN